MDLKPHPASSNQDRLRSIRGDAFGVVNEAVDHGARHHGVAEDSPQRSSDLAILKWNLGSCRDIKLCCKPVQPGKNGRCGNHQR